MIRNLVALLLALAPCPVAQSLVRDMNPGSIQPSSSPAETITIGSVTYFAATDPRHGRELWRSDGTPGGTVLVRDIRPGSVGSSPHGLVAIGTTLLFAADDGTNGIELWRSDGTAGTTVLVKDVFAGTASDASDPQYLTNVGGVLFFSAFDGGSVHGRELWRSDGTGAGTVLVRDIRTGGASSSPRTLTAVAGALFFAADDGASGLELWTSDGSTAGTVLVKDVNTGAASASPQALVSLAGALLFVADDGSNGVELWRSDGTLAGTTMVKDVAPGAGGSFPGQLTVCGARVCFAANDGTNGIELWATDGTGAGTQLVKDIHAGGAHSIPLGLTNVGGTLYLSAVTAASGRELWKSDGTGAGTVQVVELTPGAAGSVFPLMHAIQGQLAFTFDDGTHGLELWHSDGTVAGTGLVHDIASGVWSASPSSPVALGTALLFAATDGLYGFELWRSDFAIGGGTSVVRDIAAPVLVGSTLGGMLAHGDKLLFVADDGTRGRELWISDGSFAGTQIVRDLNTPTFASSDPTWLTALGGKVLFVANDGMAGAELWATDGTSEGTQLVKDIRPGAASASPAALTAFSGAIYFSANDGVAGRELWRTDGTTAGTVLVKDFDGGPASSMSAASACLQVLGASLCVIASEPTRGSELWVSDGTGSGTVPLGDVNPGSSDGVARDASSTAVAGGLLYFNGIDALHGQELWRTDGTSSGTVLVADILPGSASSLPYPMVGFRGKLYVQASDGSLPGASGNELWQSDGTASGTVLLADAWPGPGSSFPDGFAVTDKLLFFTAADGTPSAGTGRELWRTDGTSSGTVLVADVMPGTGSAIASPSARPLAFLAGSRVLFAADDGQAGYELWVSDGTGSGTVALADLNPGVADGVPPILVARVVGKKVFFAGDDGSSGMELFALPLALAGGAHVERFGAGCPGTGGNVPEISAEGSPVVGENGFAVHVERALASAPAALLFHTARMDLPLGGGCTLYPLLPAFGVNLTIGPAGAASVSLPIPDTPSAIGVELFFQYAIVDPLGAYLNLANLSDGLRIVIGRS